MKSTETKWNVTKKWLSLILACVLSVGLVACDSGAKEADSKKSGATTEAQATDDAKDEAETTAAPETDAPTDAPEAEDNAIEEKDTAKDANKEAEAEAETDADAAKEDDAKMAVDAKKDDEKDTEDAEDTKDAPAANDKLSEIKERGTLILGTSPDFPPFEFYTLDKDNKKQIVGADIALGQAIADKIGVELEIKATDFNSVLANIQAGQIDLGIAGFAATEERKSAMQFSTGYYREAESGFQGLLTTKENAEKYKDLDAIMEAKPAIGAQTSSIQYEMALKLTDPANIKQLGTLDALALALNSGDIDFVVVSTDSAEPMLETFDNFVILPQDGFDLDPENMYSTNVIGFPLGDEYLSLIEVANEVIEDALEAGDMDRWVTEAKELREMAVE